MVLLGARTRGGLRGRDALRDVAVKLEELLASDSRDNYDLGLVRSTAGTLTLLAFIKIQFFFEDGKTTKWKSVDKQAFVGNWKRAVKAKWGGRVLKRISGGKVVRLDFRFQTQIDGWMWDHWEVTVQKIPRGGWSRSLVRDGRVNEALLDSEDLRLVAKAPGQLQRGAVHEFGHMLGLDDEYPKGSVHAADVSSIMHSGEHIVGRHDAAFKKWLNAVLKDLGIS